MSDLLEKYDITYYKKMQNEADIRAEDKRQLSAKLLNASEKESDLSEKAATVIQAYHNLFSVYETQSTEEATKNAMEKLIQEYVESIEAELQGNRLLDKAKEAAASPHRRPTRPRPAPKPQPRPASTSTWLAAQTAVEASVQPWLAVVASDEVMMAMKEVELAARAAVVAREAARAAAEKLLMGKAEAAVGTTTQRQSRPFTKWLQPMTWRASGSVPTELRLGSAVKRTAHRGKQVNFNPYAGKTSTKKYRRRNKRKTKHYKKKAKRYTKKQSMRY
jgi:hypothetical protein